MTPAPAPTPAPVRALASAPSAVIGVGDLLVARLREARKRLGWGTVELAKHLAAAGAPRLTANILQNLEAGRRQQTLTVEELLHLSIALHVPPEYFLAAGENRRVQLVPGVVADARQLLGWVRGEQPLPVTDPGAYQQASLDALGERTQDSAVALRAEFLRRASTAFDGFFADSEEITRKTRQQVRDLLTDLRDAVTAGASQQELTDQIDGYLANLPTGR
ncbi:MAG: helix-turn-helix transcriptional regulator [Micromonosporaceae bacterium]|nr:helix-turn-helix transcriptional regulator [Micromonosporaceae bacterium]